MIICAAIKVIDQPGLEHGFDATVIPCWRHSDGYAILHRLCPDKKLHKGAVEGFIDHRGRFLTRKEAFRHAFDCGQLPAELRYLKDNRNENELFSEDLY